MTFIKVTSDNAVSPCRININQIIRYGIWNGKNYIEFLPNEFINVQETPEEIDALVQDAVDSFQYNQVYWLGQSKVQREN